MISQSFPTEVYKSYVPSEPILFSLCQDLIWIQPTHREHSTDDTKRLSFLPSLGCIFLVSYCSLIISPRNQTDTYLYGHFRYSHCPWWFWTALLLIPMCTPLVHQNNLHKTSYFPAWPGSGCFQPMEGG